MPGYATLIPRQLTHTILMPVVNFGEYRVSIPFAW